MQLDQSEHSQRASLPAARDAGSEATASAWHDLERLYPEMRKIAQSLLYSPSTARTLQLTALVNEAALRIVGANASTIHSDKHRLAYAAVVMRHILVDHVRRRRLSHQYVASSREIEDDVARMEAGLGAPLDGLVRALDRLRAIDPAAADLVDYRFFLELSMVETAQELKIPIRTAERKWAVTRAWLKRELHSDT